MPSSKIFNEILPETWLIFYSNFQRKKVGLSILTNRPPVPHSRVSWYLGSFEEEFRFNPWKCSSVIGHNQPTRLYGTDGRFVDIKLGLTIEP